MSKKDTELEPTPETTSRKGFSRRGFLGGTGAAAGALGTGLLEQEAQAAPPAVMPPGETEITLTVNGQPRKVTVEPRTTLLDALRERMQITGSKRVCDRGTCGACSVIVNGKVMYGCSMLAVDATGKKIETIEAFSTGKPHPIMAAFVEHDALQCGYCTPGMIVASKALLDKHPSPTAEQITEGLGGNLCRCGTYVGIKKAVAAAAGRRA